jgi:hypothetical protein
MTPEKEKQAIEKFNKIIEECRVRVEFARQSKEPNIMEMLNVDDMRTVIKYQTIMNQRIKRQNRYIKQLAVQIDGAVEAYKVVSESLVAVSSSNRRIRLEKMQLRKQIADILDSSGKFRAENDKLKSRIAELEDNQKEENGN